MIMIFIMNYYYDLDLRQPELVQAVQCSRDTTSQRLYSLLQPYV